MSHTKGSEESEAQPQATGEDGGGAAENQSEATAQISVNPAEESLPGSVDLPPASEQPQLALPVVGIGASAGGLAAIEAFFTALRALPASGMAFVVVQHLDPDHKSILVDLLKQYTQMPVYKVENGMEVQPNCAYVIPPNRDIALGGGKLHLLEPEVPRGLRLPIDFFWRSLAQDQRERAIGIVLSGSGTDGTLGLKSIKEAGGMVMVQSPESAGYDGMPRSAIATQLVDYVLPPAEMPEQLLAYVERAFGRPPVQAAAGPRAEDGLQKILLLLHAQTGHDFSGYKRATIQRRIERRMALAQIARLADYLRYLRANPPEVQLLFRELLIGVTNFFRDPEAFAALQKTVVPYLCTRSASTPSAGVRVWVPACSTGEEAYSLAILLREYLDGAHQSYSVQIFATDIDDQAIEYARAGMYPDSIAADVPPERLGRYFVEQEGSYRIAKSIRDMVVFAKQDVLKDPPFSRLDLISCRNLLIYLEHETQRRLLDYFSYALNQDGYLFLGNSETVGAFQDSFVAVGKKARIYQRRGLAASSAGLAPFRPAVWKDAPAGEARPAGEPQRKGSVRDLAERVLLETYVPASVLINADFDVLYIHGRTGKYLEPASGEASLNLLHMAREGLTVGLTTAVRQAIAGQALVRYDGLRVKNNGDTATVNLIVQPVTRSDAPHGLLMVIFEDVPQVAWREEPAADASLSPTDARIVRLEQELRAKEDSLRATIEELQTANEELTSTNEELQSANEELQSTNEELGTAKEEMQSVNEELATVNAELQKKIEEVGQANNDLSNLLASTGIGTLFVDHQLRIKRYTPATTRVINLIPTDVGRPVSDIVSRLQGYERLMTDVREVLDTLMPRESTVQNQDGAWYQLRIQPYRTLENVIEGAVLTFVDVTQQKRLQDVLHDSEERLARLFAVVPVAISVLDGKGNLAYANSAFTHLLDLANEESLQKDFTRLSYLRSDGTRMPEHEFGGRRAASEQQAVDHVETGIVKGDGSVIWTDVSAVPVALPGWKVIVVTFDLSTRRPGRDAPATSEPT